MLQRNNNNEKFNKKLALKQVLLIFCWLEITEGYTSKDNKAIQRKRVSIWTL